MSKKKDLIGQKFGLLTVLKLNEEKTQESKDRRKRGEITKSWVYWDCVCECGKKTVVTTQKLEQGHTVSCGCFRLKYDWNNIVGKTFGKWTVLKLITNKTYLCQCECGTIKEVDGYNLVRGLTNDCGCNRLQKLEERNEVDLIGQKFHRLTVIEKGEIDKFGKRTWKCQCECGSITYVITSLLVGGHTQSCGCKNSKNNALIFNYCTELKLEPIREKSFYCKETNSYLKFDIYIPILNLAIEYDGEQHYIPIDWAGKGKEWAEKQLRKTQYYDQLKNEYCQENNINLLRIPYWEKQNIKSIIKNKIQELLLTVND